MHQGAQRPDQPGQAQHHDDARLHLDLRGLRRGLHEGRQLALRDQAHGRAAVGQGHHHRPDAEVPGGLRHPLRPEDHHLGVHGQGRQLISLVVRAGGRG
ncbi:hypothetical protein SBRY_50741 [Actinacidiphila bryophytorum]|uniref:Uncharacterized protein n=1 Tax=Actinacidiphila bryophytorum TaxID=1436133 RepID=A0A9W4MIT8_9ACTN|nr:hypothetical protein SBRY_50741 [Actinacidiphila bryophytorum]